MNINDFLRVVENQTISTTKDIMVSDLEGNSKPVVKCMCNIVSYDSMSLNHEVIERAIYDKYKSEIDVQIRAFRTEMLALAEQCGVPII